MSGEVTVYKDAEKLTTEIAPVLKTATGIVVSDQGSRDGAMDFLKNIKAGLKKVAELFDPIDTAQKAARKATIEARAKLEDPLLAAEKAIKAKVLAFDREAEEKRLAEQRRLQASADEAARKERERLEKEAAKLKTPELKQARLGAAEAVVAPVVTVAPVAVKGKGEATVTRWKAELTDKAALVKAAAEGNQLAFSFLAFDQTGANTQATASNDTISIPGVRFYSEQSLSVRG